MEPEELHFKVEMWDAADAHVECVLARASNVIVARGAFDRAAKLYLDRIITLRDGTRLIAKHPHRD